MLKKAFLFACAAVIFSLLITGPSAAPRQDGRHTPPAYTVSAYEDMVAVFRPGRTKPVQVLFSYVSALPPALSEQVRRGIPVYDEKELVKILEKLSI